MEFIETSLFTKLQPKYLSNDEYAALQWFLVLNPDAGDVIPRSGGVRKVRWGQRGRGKRGGIRVVYFWKNAVNEIWFLTVYSKSEKATISGHLLRKIAEEINNA